MKKKTALITGASSGIGLELARLVARDGHDLVLVARSEGKLRELADSFAKEYGTKTTVIPADLSKQNASQDVADSLRAASLEIDILINNAGLGIAGPFVETDAARELETIQVNIVALTQLTKLLLPSMVARKSGAIMNVASTASFQPGPLMAVYYASKAYVLSFSEAIAEELRDSGVTVTALCPGPTDTGFAVGAEMTTSRLFNMTKPMTSAEVARVGYAAMQSGKRVVIAGLRNKLLAESIRVTPRRVVTTIVRKLQERG
jgi:short-subunit dehydrogenase